MRIAIEVILIIAAAGAGVLYSERVKNLFRKEEDKVKAFGKKELDKLRNKGL